MKYVKKVKYKNNNNKNKLQLNNAFSITVHKLQITTC